MLQRVAACCSVLTPLRVQDIYLEPIYTHPVSFVSQYIAARCSVLWSCSVLQCVAVCCSMLQCVVESFRALQHVAARCSTLQHVAARYSTLQCVAVCVAPPYCGAVYCSALQRVAMCCMLLQCVLLPQMISFAICIHTYAVTYTSKEHILRVCLLYIHLRT